MKTNICAFNVIAILINLVSEALRNNIRTNNKLFCDDIDMIANFVKIPLSIPPDLSYVPFFPPIYNLVEIISELTWKEKNI